MNKYLVIGTVALIAITGSGYGVSYFSVQQLEKVMSQPVKIGLVTFYPGKVKARRFEYFDSGITLAESTIEFPAGVVTIPEMEVGVVGTAVVTVSKSANGRFNKGDIDQFKINDILIETELKGLLNPNRESKTKIIVGEILLAGSKGQGKFTGLLLTVNKEEHRYWDEMRLTVANSTFRLNDGSRGTVVDLQFLQNQKPDENGRLATFHALEMNSFAITDDDNDQIFEVTDFIIEAGIEINGGRETIFFDTLRNLDADSFQKYIRTYNPQADPITLRSKDLSFNFNGIKVSYDSFSMESRNRVEKKILHNNSHVRLEKLKFTGGGARFLVDEFVYTVNGSVPKQASEKLQRSAWMENQPLDPKTIDTLFAVLEDLQGESELSFTNIVFQENNSTPPLTITSGSLETKVASAQGVLFFSMRPEIEISGLQAWRNKLALPADIDSISQQFFLSLEKINLLAFKEVLQQVNSENQTSLVKMTDVAIAEFVNSKPELSIESKTSLPDGLEVDLDISFLLDGDLAGYSIVTLFENSVGVDRELLQSLARASTSNIKLRINNYQKLAAIIDEIQGRGSGEFYLAQARPFTQIEGDVMKVDVLLKSGSVALNGQPNLILQMMFNGIMSR